MNKKTLEKAVASALEVRKNAYAPFSNFAVGAAIITKDGSIFTGVNVENSSFGATNCAERTALFSAITAGQRDFEAIVIASVLNGKAVFPCGICRQVLADFNPKMRVVLVNSDTKQIEQDLLLSEIFQGVFEFGKEQ
ncbi:cytidine deaminase [bacterium]|nr:cytidine deaminase [bacterium]